jgi:hypothetical protein
LNAKGALTLLGKTQEYEQNYRYWGESLPEKKYYCELCNEEISLADHDYFDGLCPECLEKLLPEEENHLQE